MLVEHYTALVPVNRYWNIQRWQTNAGHTAHTCTSEIEEKARCVHTHTAAVENNKARHANWADGSFFCVHALACINITTEDHSCDSSLVSSPNRHTHLHLQNWIVHKQTWKYAALHRFMTPGSSWVTEPYRVSRQRWHSITWIQLENIFFSLNLALKKTDHISSAVSYSTASLNYVFLFPLNSLREVSFLLCAPQGTAPRACWQSVLKRKTLPSAADSKTDLWVPLQWALRFLPCCELYLKSLSSCCLCLWVLRRKRNSSDSTLLQDADLNAICALCSLGAKC